MAKLLIVDDVRVDRHIAGGLIEEQGLIPIFAENGRQALEKLEQERPDAVLTDLQMPEMDGLELVRQIRERFPTVPVILMTAYGSEQIAVQALRQGAASYVPKKTLSRDLLGAITTVLNVAQATRDRMQACSLLQHQESLFLLGYQSAGPRALVNHLQDSLTQVNFCGEGDLIQIGTALTEALRNAIDHGNLELNSALRESDDGAYSRLGLQRAEQPPYCDRRIRVSARLTPSKVTYVIRDQGPGFDVTTLPDPTDPNTLVKPSGRGILLIRTFMDEVSFNQHGNEITMTKHRSVEQA